MSAKDLGDTDRIERPREASRRLFFALWPQHDQQTAFAHAARKSVKASGGRPVPVGNIHLTLAFLGSVPERRIVELAAVARKVATSFAIEAKRLDLVFERLEHWEQSQVLCAVPTDEGALAATTRLAQTLHAELAAADFASDLKPFRAHVTLARKVHRGSEELDMHPLLWRFTDFALVESLTDSNGAIYSVLDSWDLCIGLDPAQMNP